MKRLLIIAALLLFAAPFAEAQFIVGDINGDGKVNAQDLDALMRIVLGLDPVPASPVPTILMGPSLNSVAGNEINVYWDGVIMSPVPISELNIKVTCSKGIQQNFRWTYTPTASDVGSYPWKMDIYLAGTLVSTTQSTLRVFPAKKGAGSLHQVIVIGDSTTSNGMWLGETAGLLSKDLIVLSTQGSQSDQVKTPSYNGFVHHEAYSGVTVDWFYTNPKSPFLFNGNFDFSSYLSNQRYQLTKNDWVLIDLGINDIYSYLNDADEMPKITQMINELNAMINNIQTVVPGLQIGIMITIPPAHDQDAFGASYGTVQTQMRYKRNRDLWVQQLIQTFTGKENSGIYLVPIHTNLDTINNMETIATQANARNPTLVTRQNNGVHPNEFGFYQIADVVYAFFKSQF